MTDNDNLQTTLEQTEDGFCTLQIRAKRGNGTRDQDRITATLGRDTLEDVEAQREDLLEMVEDTVESVRDMQPPEDTDE